MIVANENTPPSTGEPSRALVWAVYIMGILLVLMFLGLIGGLIYKAKARMNAPAPSNPIDLGLSQSAIRQMIFDSGKLAVTTDTELVVIDVASRTVILRTPIKP